MAVIQDGSNSTTEADVSAGALHVNLPTTAADAGFATLVSEVDPGTTLGSRTMRELEATDDYRLRVGMDTPIFVHMFEGTNIARDRISQADTTATAAQASGFLTLNSGNSTTSGQGTNIRTYRTFPLWGAFTTYFEFWCREGNPDATNSITEFGCGFVSAVTAQATDGAFFRRLSGGQLRAVVVNNSTDVVAQDLALTTTPSRDGSGVHDATEVNHYVIGVTGDKVEFWINDSLVYEYLCNSAYPNPTAAMEQPAFARVYMSGTASAARSLSIGRIEISQGEASTGKPWGHVCAGGGGGAYQIQPGTASGPTVTRGAGTTGWPTSATARAAGTWTATTAPALASLGGQWLSPAISTLTSEADYPIFSYGNPAGTSTLPGKVLYITGVKWGNTVATAAAATNSITLHYLLGVGGTSSATTQTEGAAVVAQRGISLDLIPFKSTAAIGDYVAGGNMDFTAAPLAVYPGCFITFVVRPFGTVASNTLVVAGSVAFSGYFA